MSESGVASGGAGEGGGGGGGDGGNVDRLLFKNLVEMVPLVESLMDRKANSSYSRRASVVYTPAPAQSKKAGDIKSAKSSQSVSAQKRRDLGDASKKGNQDSNGNASSVMSSTALQAENMQKEREDLALLRAQIDELQKKLLEKDETLKAAESSVSQVNVAYATIDELRHQVAEKDALVKSTSSQLHNAKITLADKQASLEKLEWEVKTSNRKVEDLQGDVSSMEFEITSLMTLFEKLSENDSVEHSEDGIPDAFEALQFMNDIENIDTEKIEQERATYTAALATARENSSDESLMLASEARLRLQVLVL